MIETVWNFIHKYYIVPGYDIVDTLTYGIILGLAVFGIIPLLRKYCVQITKRFLVAVSPFIVFGATMRELVYRGLGIYSSAGVYPENPWAFFVVSPGIFLTMFALTLAALAAAKYLQKKKGIDYTKTLFCIGLVPMVYNVFLIMANIENAAPLFYVSAALVISGAFLFIIMQFRGFGFLYNEKNYLVVLAHLFDASATYVGIDLLGGGEQHVLPRFLIEHFGTALVMFPLKLIVVVAVLYLIDKSVEDALERRFIKFVILVLGLGPAIRDVALMVL
ncbi:MAG: hypothetical protein MSIBF_07145 [Candidatus Altiarchaeales archaeon IMC4]|nr:MAG: hypothetical protein MSIBF_07145 [Candidatus Altiarchaeales archaeon IMC4]